MLCFQVGAREARADLYKALARSIGASTGGAQKGANH